MAYYEKPFIRVYIGTGRPKEGTTVVLNGDAPLITKETLSNLIQYHKENNMQGINNINIINAILWMS